MKRGIALIVYLLLAGAAIAQPNIDYREKGAPIPPFVMEQANGKMLTNGILKKGAPVIVVIFSPQCDHCGKALDTLQSLSQSLKHTQLVLLTEAVHKPYLKDFLTKHGYDKDPLFKNAGIDKGNLISYIYTYGMLPQFNIYNAQHRLVKTFTGIFPMDSLKMFIH
jgi:hypothetical protein